MFRALFVEALNHNAAEEKVAAAVAGQALPNGMAESNGKPAKNGKRKPR